MREIGKALALITQIGVSMVVPIFLCLILGSFLDKNISHGQYTNDCIYNIRCMCWL